MDSIFSKIIRGEIPSIKVAENEYAYAFMDIFPLREGHVLVVPKKEIDVFYDIEDGIFCEWMLFSKKISKAMESCFQKRIGLSIIGLEVSHAHIHLIPIDSANDINFCQEKLKLSSDKLREIAESIQKFLN